MKVQWEEKDINPGRLVRKTDTGVTGLWMISWRHRTSLETEDDKRIERNFGIDPPKLLDTHRWGLVSMADGMWMQIGSGIKSAVAVYLNETDALPIELTDGLPQDFLDKHRK
jgi:hypothetical protein